MEWFCPVRMPCNAEPHNFKSRTPIVLWPLAIKAEVFDVRDATLKATQALFAQHAAYLLVTQRLEACQRHVICKISVVNGPLSARIGCPTAFLAERTYDLSGCDFYITHGISTMPVGFHHYSHFDPSSPGLSSIRPSSTVTAFNFIVFCLSY